MRQTLQIMRTELRQLFFSPVAWILLVIFILQAGFPFLESFRSGLKMMVLEFPFWRATDQLYASGLMQTVQHSLYLYLPLLTMSLLSNEFSSGSIKLLYSSPVGSTQVIVGKYLSVLCYGVVLMVVLLGYILLGVVAVPNLSWPVLVSALLGFALLFMAYAAIGLFISCLTEYQIVSAVATFALFAILNYVGELGQDIPLLRDVCYWLCLPQHTQDMIHGLICSADIIYFVLIIAAFLALSVVVLCRRKSEVSRRGVWGWSVAIVAVVCVVGVVTSRPAARLYADVTETKYLTLSPLSQQVLGQLRHEPVTITTYVNIADESYSKRFALPTHQLHDMARFDHYRRFLPHLQLRYVYYYKNLYQEGDDDEALQQKALEATGISRRQLTPLEEIDCREELQRQGYQMTRLVEGCGRHTFLNMFNDPRMMPGENEITAALAIVAGQGLGAWLAGGDTEAYSLTISEAHNRQALRNQGFTVSQSAPATDKDCQLAIVLNPQEPLSADVQARLTQLLDSGTCAFIAVNPENADNLNPLLRQLGLQAGTEELRQSDPEFDADLTQGQLTQEAVGLMPQLSGLVEGTVSMPRCGVLSVDTVKSPYTVTPLLTDKEGGRLLACLLTRTVDGHEQRIVVAANAVWLSNRELATRRNGITAANQILASQLLFWAGGQGQYPLQIVYPIPSDMQVSGAYENIYPLRWLYLGLLPLLVALAGLTIIIIRKRK